MNDETSAWALRTAATWGGVTLAFAVGLAFAWPPTTPIHRGAIVLYAIAIPLIVTGGIRVHLEMAHETGRLLESRLADTQTQARAQGADETVATTIREETLAAHRTPQCSITTCETPVDGIGNAWPSNNRGLVCTACWQTYIRTGHWPDDHAADGNGGVLQ